MFNIHLTNRNHLIDAWRGVGNTGKAGGMAVFTYACFLRIYLSICHPSIYQSSIYSSIISFPYWQLDSEEV
jgi:hypothetical protein